MNSSKDWFLQVPKFLEKYDLVSEIGKGSYGYVWLCNEKAMPQNQFAAKIMCLTNPASERFAKREVDNLVKMAEAPLDASSVGRRFVMGLHAIFDAPPYVVLVLEYYAGGTLRDALPRLFTEMPNAEQRESFTRRISSQITLGLQFLQSLNLIHGDLKPENIALTSKNLKTAEIRFIDFGFSKDTGIDPLVSMVYGTRAYLGPERFCEGVGRPNTIKSEIWALGCIVFELMTGQLAWDAVDASLDESDSMPTELGRALSYHTWVIVDKRTGAVTGFARPRSKVFGRPTSFLTLDNVAVDLRDSTVELRSVAVSPEIKSFVAGCRAMTHGINDSGDPAPSSDDRLTVDGALQHPFLRPFFKGVPAARWPTRNDGERLAGSDDVSRLMALGGQALKAPRAVVSEAGTHKSSEGRAGPSSSTTVPELSSSASEAPLRLRLSRHTAPTTATPPAAAGVAPPPDASDVGAAAAVAEPPMRAPDTWEWEDLAVRVKRAKAKNAPKCQCLGRLQGFHRKDCPYHV